MAVSDYLTAPGLNNAISGINIAENCSPAGLNDAIRQLMADIRKYANDGNWFAFGTGSGSANGSFIRLDSTRVQFAGSTMAAYYYPGRRVRANMTSGTTLAGTITAFSYSGSNNTITVNWDSPIGSQDIGFLELGMDSSSLGFADPTASYQAATKNYTDNLVSQTSNQLTTKINGVIPVGSVFYLAVTTIPTGFLRADGALVSRTNYSNLFAAIGTAFGTGDGFSTFALPDLRGEFIRGHDNGRGIDNNRALGSFQASVVGSHSHRVSFFYLTGEYNGTMPDAMQVKGSLLALSAGSGTPGAFSPGYQGSRNYAGDGLGAIANNNNSAENLPRNIALTPIIKY